MKDLKIAQKAWTLNTNDIKEGFYFYEFCVYADTRNKAKSAMMSTPEHYDMVLESTNEDVTYLTIPVQRFKDADKYFFEDKELTKSEIENIKRERERKAQLEAILNNSNITHCYIEKGGYYCPNCSGYTDIRAQAGVYLKEDAVRHANGCDRVSVIPINVEAHNKMINDEIESLKTRLI